MVGSDGRSAEVRALFALALLGLCHCAHSDTLYKYRDGDGNWVFTDRRPAAGTVVEQRRLKRREDTKLVILQRETETGFELIAENQHYVPVQLVLAATDMENVEAAPEPVVRATIPARSGAPVLALSRIDPSAPADFRFRYEYLPGDPDARADQDILYRVPFASATRFPVSQAYPENMTHDSLASRYAVDIAAPVGTGIYAARAGVVFEVRSGNFQGGTDRERHAPKANLIRILHDDGTMAVYAHLNWDSIRVRPGDSVSRGEYIADSGNTGFTTGPHLHFAVQRNAGLRLDSVPVRFAGPDGVAVVPRTGIELIVY